VSVLALDQRRRSFEQRTARSFGALAHLPFYVSPLRA
jgi:hypothetical protein